MKQSACDMNLPITYEVIKFIQCYKKDTKLMHKKLPGNLDLSHKDLT